VRSAYGPDCRQLSTGEWRSRFGAFKALGVLMVAMIAVHAFNALILGHAWDRYGILPARADGLWPGVVSAPFLHVSNLHLANNLIALVVLGGMAAMVAGNAPSLATIFIATALPALADCARRLTSGERRIRLFRFRRAGAVPAIAPLPYCRRCRDLTLRREHLLRHLFPEGLHLLGGASCRSTCWPWLCPGRAAFREEKRPVIRAPTLARCPVGSPGIYVRSTVHHGKLRFQFLRAMRSGQLPLR
jgi:hypothetical protein